MNAALRMVDFSNKHQPFKAVVMLVAGLFAALGFAPYYLLPVLVISFSALMLFLFYARSYKESFLIGWIFGVGYFLGGLYWIVCPLIFYFFDPYWWLIPLAAIVVPVLSALYFAAGALILQRFKTSNALTFALYFICVWILLEFLRTELFTGFPWLIVGYSLVKWPALIQSASLFGLFFLSLMVFVLSAALFIIAMPTKHRCVQMFICSFLLMPFIFNAVYGYLRLSSAQNSFSEYKIKIVQPNIEGMISRQAMDQNASDITQLANLDNAVDSKLLYVLLPEGVLNNFRKDTLLKFVKECIPEQGFLIAGGDRVEYANHKIRSWNSVFLINHNGVVVDSYDKAHLVPFGEYLPLRTLIPSSLNAIVSTFTNGFVDFSKGSGPRTINVKHFSFSPMICYESLFSNHAAQLTRRPRLLINFTTDMWYRSSSAPYQHFDMSALRAVEYGVPLIRVASTGISGIVDAYGRTLSRLELGQRGVLYENIPTDLSNETLYSIAGNSICALILICLFALGFMCRHNSHLKS